MKVRRHYEEEVECVGEVEGRCELKGVAVLSFTGPSEGSGWADREVERGGRDREVN